MIVYLDLLFLFNFFLNIVFLVVIEIIYKTKIKMLRIALGGVCGGFIVILELFDYKLSFILKISGGILIGLVGLEKCGGIKNVIKYSSFYTLNLASVGLVAAFGINTHAVLLFSIGAIILVYIVESNKNLIIFLNRLKYNIIVDFNKTSLNLVGYLDTGNFSEHGDKPIIYISDRYYPEELNDEEFQVVRIETLNMVSNIRAYQPKRCLIEKGRRKIEVDVLVVFCNITSHECLLNARLLI